MLLHNVIQHSSENTRPGEWSITESIDHDLFPGPGVYYIILSNPRIYMAKPIIVH
ncbi:MAG: hypothetical protein KAR19_17680 [Bacteroidales bacterium]|nr:hypothetical protein [Bacteroidales bacterium]